jgi:hypothetical protein
MALSRCMMMIPSVAASAAPSSWTKPCCLSTIVKYMYHGSYFDFTSDFISEWLNISRWHQHAARKNKQEDQCDKGQKHAFQSFGHLPNEMKLYVLAFAAEVSMDSSNEMQFTVTSVLSYHVPHQSQLNTQSSGLPPRTPSLLENPLSFFTNTRHPSQRYHLSLSTKKDCIFSRNTVVNIDVAPRLLVHHIIT